MLSDLCTPLREQGFVVIEEDSVGWESRDAMRRFGRLLTLPGLAEVQTLKLREREGTTPNTYSGNYGRGEFPLHTDLAHWSLPPRYFVLRCVVGAEGVPTRLVDGLDLIEAVGELRMSRAVVRPRRPIAGRQSLLRLLDAHAGAKLLRWDDLFIVPVTTEGKRAFEVVRHHLALAKPIEITLFRPGDTLIVDNWRMLHGRAAALPTVTRQLDRAYFDELEGA